MCVPALFHLTRHNSLDREIGEYSYPIYLTHHMAFMAAIFFTADSAQAVPLALGLTLALSIGLHLLVQAPIERIRQARVRRD